MTLAQRLQNLRKETGLSQEAVGSQGFVSAPGWIKLENGQRQASERLINKLIDWLINDKYITKTAAGTLKEELMTLKYMGSRSAFVRNMAVVHAKGLPTGSVLLAKVKPVEVKRGRPPGILKRTVAAVGVFMGGGDTDTILNGGETQPTT